MAKVGELSGCPDFGGTAHDQTLNLLSKEPGFGPTFFGLFCHGFFLGFLIGFGFRGFKDRDSGFRA